MRKTIEKVLLHLLTDRYAKVGTKSELNVKYKEILPPPYDLQLSKDEIDRVADVWGKLSKKIDFRRKIIRIARKVFTLLHTLFVKFRIKRVCRNNFKNDYKEFNGVNLQPLSSDEYQSVQSYWSAIGGGKVKRLGFRVFKTFEYFDPKWITVDIMSPRMIVALEDPMFQSSLVHKGGYSIYLDELPQPKNYLKCIEGIYFNTLMEPVSFGEAVMELQNLDAFIIKSTYGSCQGKSVQKIVPSTCQSLEDVIKSYGQNFVCQQVIEQYSKLSVLHPESVNTFRILSLFMNGRVSVCAIILRIGQGDSIVDNAGAGGIMIGVDRNGKLREYGYDHCAHRHYENDRGLKFKGIQFVEIEHILQLVYKYHPKYFPSMGIVAWDWALDEKGLPVFIEANLGNWSLYPDITTTQLAKGAPLFDERTEEVIEFVKKHWNRLYWHY